MNTARRLLLAVAVLGCMSACTPFATDEPPPARYLLIAPAEDGAYGELGWLPAPLSLARPIVPAGLDGERIGVIHGQRRLDYVADARWAEPLPDLLHRVLAASLAPAMEPGMPGAGSRTGARYVIELRFERFHPVYPAENGVPPRIEVGLVAALVDRSDGRVLARARGQHSARADENRLGVIIAHLETALHEAFAEAMVGIHAGLDEDGGRAVAD